SSDLAEMLNSLTSVNHVNLITSSDEERWKNLMRNEKKPGQVSDLLKKYVRKAVALRRGVFMLWCEACLVVRITVSVRIYDCFLFCSFCCCVFFFVVIGECVMIHGGQRGGWW